MPPRKRRAATPETPVAPAGRRSTRISSSGKKSQYFESDSDDNSDDNSEDYTAEEVKATNGNGTGRKRGRPRKNPASRPTPTGKKAKIEQDDDSDEFQEDGKDEEEDDDDELDEDEEPRVTITPLNKMRGTGGVDYEDDRLHPNTLLFLKDLEANNKRSWLKCKLSCQFLVHRMAVAWALANLVIRCSQRPGIPPLPPRLELLRRDPNADNHRRGPHDPRAAPQGRRLPHLPGHPLQQRPDPLQAALQRRLLAHGQEGPLRLLLRPLRARVVLHRRRALAPRRGPPGQAARVHRREAPAVEEGAAGG